jgi:hypothetical protein
MFVGRSDFSRDLCAIENLGFGVYRSGFHCDPCVIEGGEFGAKAPPIETVFL